MTTPTFGSPDDRDGVPDDELRPGATASPYASSPPPPDLPPPVYGEATHARYPGDDGFGPDVGRYGPGYGYSPAPALPATNGVATAGGVCGIVAASISWIPLINVFSLVLSLIAVALGGVGLKRANDYGSEGRGTPGKGMAITGIVLGVIGIAIALVLITALGSALNDLSHSTNT